MALLIKDKLPGLVEGFGEWAPTATESESDSCHDSDSSESGLSSSDVSN